MTWVLYTCLSDAAVGISHNLVVLKFYSLFCALLVCCQSADAESLAEACYRLAGPGVPGAIVEKATARDVCYRAYLQSHDSYLYDAIQRLDKQDSPVSDITPYEKVTGTVLLLWVLGILLLILAGGPRFIIRMLDRVENATKHAVIFGMAVATAGYLGGIPIAMLYSAAEGPCSGEICMGRGLATIVSLVTITAALSLYALVVLGVLLSQASYRAYLAYKRN